MCCPATPKSRHLPDEIIRNVSYPTSPTRPAYTRAHARAPPVTSAPLLIGCAKPPTTLPAPRRSPLHSHTLHLLPPPRAAGAADARLGGLVACRAVTSLPQIGHACQARRQCLPPLWAGPVAGWLQTGGSASEPKAYLGPHTFIRRAWQQVHSHCDASSSRVCLAATGSISCTGIVAMRARIWRINIERQGGYAY